MRPRNSLRLLGATAALLPSVAASEGLVAAYTVGLVPGPVTDLDLTLVVDPPDSTPYTIEAGIAPGATIQVETVEGFGQVVTAIAFEMSGFTYFDGWSFEFVDPSYGFNASIYIVDWHGRFMPVGLSLPATPVARNQSEFDPSPLQYVIFDGYTQGCIEGTCLPEAVIFHDEDPALFPLAGTASIEISAHPSPGMATVTVTIPFDSTEIGSSPPFHIGGPLELVGEIPLEFEAVPVVPVLPFAGLGVALLLLASGAGLVRKG